MSGSALFKFLLQNIDNYLLRLRLPSRKQLNARTNLQTLTRRPFALSTSVDQREKHARLSLTTSNSLRYYVQSLIEEHGQITANLNDPDKEVEQGANLRHVYLTQIVEWHRRIEQTNREIDELDKLANDPSATDSDIVEMAKEDIADCRQSLVKLEDELLRLLTPPEPFDRHDVIVEVTAGVGGLEAMLFAKSLYDMYKLYAIFKGWNVQELDFQSSDLNGMRHGILSVVGVGAYSCLKFEGGVHRVQRVPQTERSGRIHTSTVSVAVLPQPTEIEVKVRDKDLKLETMRSSGPGGQHVNKADSAVRLTHLPTGIVIECQMERFQASNKEIALSRLRAKLYEREYEADLMKRQSSRKIQVGSRGRAEKIRTYNFMQDRITDHRIGANFHRINEFFNCGEELDRAVQQLKELSQQEILLELINKY